MTLDETILSVQHLNKSFGKKQALHDVTFTCQRGHIVGLIGANGAGKTTIMKAILSQTRYRGNVTIAGKPSTFGHHPVLAEVGALIEYPGIYPFMSGRDHLKLFARPTADRNQRIQTVVTDLKLADYVDRPVKGYSLGMKQKIGIAMALVNDPQLVILDEPMNGLDAQATKDLRELIQRKQAAGVSFLIASHILAELQKLAEDLIVIDHGRVVQETTMAKLLAHNQHFVVLQTDDDAQAATLLRRNGYHLASEVPVKVRLREHDQLADIMGHLTTAGIGVTDLRHEDDDLEKAVLQLIAN